MIPTRFYVQIFKAKSLFDLFLLNVQMDSTFEASLASLNPLLRVSPKSDSKSESSLSHGFMSDGFISKKVVDGQCFSGK